MNRTVIRTFGFFMAIFGVCANKANAVLSSNCTYVSDGITNGAIYEQGNCNETGIVRGWIVYDPALVSLFSQCKNAGAKNVTFPCGGYGSGYCSSTGIYCPSQQFFVSQGCTNGGTVTYSVGCKYIEYDTTESIVETKFFFLRCVDGYYQKLPNVPTSGLAIGDFTGNCLPCSGLRFVGSQLQTYVNSAGASSSGTIRWEAGTGVYITSCRAYLNGTLTDNNGTFQIAADGCPYVN